MVRIAFYTLYLLTPLVQLIRLYVVNGGLHLRFINPLSLNRLDDLLRTKVYTLDLLTPLTQLMMGYIV